MWRITVAGLALLLSHGSMRAQSGTLTTLYGFSGQNGDGSYPEGGVAIGAGGVLYGTTLVAGASGTGIYGDGTVFQLAPPAAQGGVWTETVLHSFAGADGMSPYAAPLIGADGTLYGTTRGGGTSEQGLVFALSPGPDGAWTYTVLHNFQAGPDGSQPLNSVVFGIDGALYGTTSFGGEGCKQKGDVGCGTAFVLAPPTASGGSWTESVLYAFGQGAYPSGITAGHTGALYVTTNDTNSDHGRVFRLTPPTQSGAPWNHAMIANLNLEGTSGVTITAVPEEYLL